MKQQKPSVGFALTTTLVLMVLIAIIVVAYLVSTRIERSTSSVYANRLRAKIQADSALAAAIHLLKDNTRYGNYVTAMPAPSPSPLSIYTEIYRPANPSDPNHGVQADDYLRLDNAAGEILISRATASSSPGPDPRPTPEPIPTPLAAASLFTVTAPTFSVNGSYDFNQIVTVDSTTGRLVQPSPSPAPPPAYGEWVNVRDANGQFIGRYAFFVEDESMKVNVNYAGNNVGGSNMRVNDLSTPLPVSTPTAQIQEIDPSAILPVSANRATADTNLNNLGGAGSRLSTRLTLGLLGEWSSAPNAFPNYSHLATAFSEDDNTTARGWQRLDLNAITSGLSGNAAKVAVATRIANWIRDAWTGSTSIANLQDYQMFGDDWSRKQIAADIVDYLTSDNTPTDMGNIIPSGFSIAVPVIGFKKTPYLSGVNIVYQASNSTYPGSGVGTFTATLKMRVQVQFLNMYETALDLVGAMGNTAQSRIELKGLPIIQKNGSTVYDPSPQTLTIKLSDLIPVNGSGTAVTAGVDGASTSGARTFQTTWLDTQTVSFNVATTDQRPRFLAGSTTAKWIGNRTGNVSDDFRIDDTAIVNSATTTKWCNTGCGGLAGDFLKESNSTARQIAAMSYIAGYQGAIVSGASPGDPRYRGRLISDRWNFDNSRTDADPADNSNKLDSLVDKVDINCRVYGFDWFDNSGDRPLALLRNGSMINIGELGNIAACEYPWRTLYFQYPERPANTTSTSSPGTEIPLRRSHSVDYVLADLFRTQSSQTRSGAININTQQTLGAQQRTLGPLFLGVPIGTQNISQTAPDSLDRIDNDPGSSLVASISNRRVGPAATPFPDNGPIRPFFQAGELASVLNRLVNTSPGGNGTTSDVRGNCSTVSYGVLRTNATTASEKDADKKVNANIQRDMQVEQLFRQVSNSITTRGNVFRVLYVGQSLKDGLVQAEYLGEAVVKRSSVFTPDSSNPDIVRTSDSTYKLVANRVITE
jgi:Tfp pilus assembly protein PilX